MRFFFASDMHGSERCFRKFVAAARFYDADVLILGGDLAGKQAVFLRQRMSGGFEVWDDRRTLLLATNTEVNEYEQSLAAVGTYSIKLEAHATPSEADRSALLEEAICARVKTWVDYAEERLSGRGTKVVAIPGNDDPISIDSILNNSSTVINCDRRVVAIDGLQYAGLGCSTPTPWNTPREFLDSQIEVLLAQTLSCVDWDLPLILNFHIPPFGSGLDTCPVLDANFRPVLGPGGPVTAPVGSQAVRSLITARQPMLALHGHVHEARGCTQIGKTLCVNPGSLYTEGRLLGFLGEVRSGRVINWMLTEG